MSQREASHQLQSGSQVQDKYDGNEDACGGHDSAQAGGVHAHISLTGSAEQPPHADCTTAPNTKSANLLPPDATAQSSTQPERCHAQLVLPHLSLSAPLPSSAAAAAVAPASLHDQKPKSCPAIINTAAPGNSSDALRVEASHSQVAGALHGLPPAIASRSVVNASDDNNDHTSEALNQTLKDSPSMRDTGKQVDPAGVAPEEDPASGGTSQPLQPQGSIGSGLHAWGSGSQEEELSEPVAAAVGSTATAAVSTGLALSEDVPALRASGRGRGRARGPRVPAAPVPPDLMSILAALPDLHEYCTLAELEEQDIWRIRRV